MPTLQEIREKRESILTCAKRNGVMSIRVFGSVSRSEEREESDVDFLVRFEKTRTLVDHARLIDDLASLLGIKVDVIDEGGLSPYLRDEVLHDAVPL